MPPLPLPLPDPELADDAIRLRPPSLADVAAITAACQDPGIQRYTFVPVPYGEDDARAWIRDAERNRAAGVAMNLLAVDHHDDTDVLAAVGLLHPDWRARRIEVGYWGAPHARGRGVVTRAVALLARWALATFDVARVVAYIDAPNAASRAVVQRAGFTLEDGPPDPVDIKGRTWMLVCYSLSAR
ncbi:MAG: family N-acetyltransferase [Conexibacter sp.]|nr:family N-acetyltransferase [Conexibacter sp.]